MEGRREGGRERRERRKERGKIKAFPMARSPEQEGREDISQEQHGPKGVQQLPSNVWKGQDPSTDGKDHL